MSLRDAALRYGVFLLRQIKLAGFGQEWARVEDLCDRFEHLMANLPAVPHPLVWEGDYA